MKKFQGYLMMSLGSLLIVLLILWFIFGIPQLVEWFSLHGFQSIGSLSINEFLSLSSLALSPLIYVLMGPILFWNGIIKLKHKS